MNIGAMRHRITIQRTVPFVNENGFEEILPEVYKTVWAAVSNLHGSEFFEAAQTNAENTVKFTIRYVSGIKQDMEILFQGRKYNIMAIDNIKYRNKYLEIKAVEVNQDGAY